MEWKAGSESTHDVQTSTQNVATSHEMRFENSGQANLVRPLVRSAFDAHTPWRCLSANFRVVASDYSELLHAEVESRPLDSQTCRGPVGAGDNPAGML